MALLGISEYGTSSSSDSDSEEEGIKDSEHNCGEFKLKLPPPDLDCSNRSPSSDSIFHNPFHKEHKLNIDTLSRHVLPSENKERQKKEIPHTQVKICRKFSAKGKCRFGDKCKFSHALPGTEEHRDITEHNAKRKLSKIERRRNNPPGSMLIGDLDGLFDNDADKDGNNRKRKNRPGLAGSLIPPKKSLSMYNRFSKS